VIIRDANDGDVAEIVEIANALLPTTAIEWTDRLHTHAERLVWLHEHRRKGDAVLVADAGGQVEGVASYGDFRDAGKWPGYRFTVENTVHVRERSWGKGIGRLLMTALTKRAVAAGKHVMVAGIDAENIASIEFHACLGFAEVARLPTIGWKLDRWLTLVLMQRRLVELTTPPAELPDR
jgi:phosphinothricin acetyltransferase